MEDYCLRGLLVPLIPRAECYHSLAYSNDTGSGGWEKTYKFPLSDEPCSLHALVVAAAWPYVAPFSWRRVLADARAWLRALLRFFLRGLLLPCAAATPDPGCAFRALRST